MSTGKCENRVRGRSCQRGLVACLGLGALFIVTACGAKVTEKEQDGQTGSETHWLSKCSSNAACGVGQCLCGVCTIECTTDDECPTDSGFCYADGSRIHEALCRDFPDAPSSLCAEPTASTELRDVDAGTPNANAELDESTVPMDTPMQAPSSAAPDAGDAVGEGDDTLDASSSNPFPEGIPALRCGTAPGDEGTMDQPITVQFDSLWDIGWDGSVGTGASCYRVEAVQRGNEFALRNPDRDSTGVDISIDVEVYVYGDDGFGAEPICVTTPMYQNRCRTYATDDRTFETDVRYIVVDGSEATAGGRYVLWAEP